MDRIIPLALLILALFHAGPASAATPGCSLETYQALSSCRPPESCRSKIIEFHVGCIREHQAAYQTLDQARTEEELSAAVQRIETLKNKYAQMRWSIQENGQIRLDAPDPGQDQRGALLTNIVPGYDDAQHAQQIESARKRVQNGEPPKDDPRQNADQKQNIALINHAAETFLENERWGNAEQVLQAHAAMKSDDHAHALLGMARLKQGKFDDALAQAREALRLNPKNELALAVKNSAHSSLRVHSIRGLKTRLDSGRLAPQQPDETASASADPRPTQGPRVAVPGIALGKSVKPDPHNAPALIDGAYALHNQGRDAEALEALDRALTLEPRNARGVLYHAMVLEKLGRQFEALHDYSQASKLDPAYARFFYEAHLRLIGVKAGAIAQRRNVKAWAAGGLAILVAAVALLWMFRGSRQTS